MPETDEPTTPTPGSPAVRIVLAVLTYRRPDDLLAVLPPLVEQAAAQPDDVRILVIDNDPAGSARDAVERASADARARGVAVEYSHEPEPGIAAARNRALTASADRDVLIYIDDDERPADGWLGHLLRTYRATGATAVVGPVVSTFETTPAQYVTAGRFFDRRRLPTGTPVTVAATNNLLLDLAVIRRMGLSFAVNLGTAGGSDTLFTRQIVQRGGSMVWCDEAIVYDVVPAARATAEWTLRRALRSGNSWSVTSLRLTESARGRLTVRLRLIGAGLIRLAGGGLRWVVGAVTRRLSLRARGMRSMMRGAGMVLGAAGVTYREYARTRP